MELRQLRLFVEIARTGSLNKASRKLNISQPALSRQLQALERELAGALFERRVSGMVLTKEGRQLLNHAEDIVERTDALRGDLVKGDRHVSGAVTIGAAPAVGQHFFGPIAERIAAEHPAIELRFREGHAFDMLAGLEKNEIDVAFMIDPDPLKGMEIVPLFSEPLFLIGPSDDPRFRPEGIALSDLKDYPLAIYPKLTGPRKAIDKAMFRSRATLNVRYETNFNATIRDLVRRRLAYALVTRSALARQQDDFAMMPVANLTLVRTLVYMRASLRLVAVATTVEIAKEEVVKAMAIPSFVDCDKLLHEPSKSEPLP